MGSGSTISDLITFGRTWSTSISAPAPLRVSRWMTLKQFVGASDLRSNATTNLFASLATVEQDDQHARSSTAALGQSRHFRPIRRMSASPPTAARERTPLNRRFGPLADNAQLRGAPLTQFAPRPSCGIELGATGKCWEFHPRDERDPTQAVKRSNSLKLRRVEEKMAERVEQS